MLSLCAAAAPDPKLRPNQRTLDCTASGCHAAQTTAKFVHNPVSKGSCDMCHEYKNEKAHTFQLRRQGGELCTFCHIGGGTAVGRVSHKPFERGECLSCHNPHGGPNRVMLRHEDASKLCASCHGDITRGRTNLHGPVSTGSCLACHAAHRSAQPKLLAFQGRDLCLSCHEEMGAEVKAARFVHKPLKDGDCRQCHEVHASNFKMQLKQEPAKLCTSCHEKVKDQIASATVKHSAATQGDACINCHTPHGSALAKLMKSDPAKACLSCHKSSVAAPGGRAVAAMTAITDPTQFKHGPIREGDCAGCHIAHGSKQEHLLTKAYAPEFYQPFSLEKYDLCFSCHDKQLVLQKETTGLTGFRNGDRNLHYLHVNNEEKGRNCRACHSTHTSSKPLHIRESVKFGNWDLPIGFTQTPTGGACKSACHQEYRYDRKNPVVNKVDERVDSP